METVKRALTGVRRDPVYTIGVILAVAMFIFAIYFVGPWYVGGPTTAIGASFDQPVARAILGALYMIPSVATVMGTVKGNRWRRFGTFGMAIGFLFITLLRLITLGLTPAIWIFILACGLIASLIYLHVSLSEDTT